MFQFPARLTRAQASSYLDLQHGIRRKVGTLARLAMIGGGPAFRKIGGTGVAYDRADLDRWADEIVSAPRSSTSQTT